MEKVLWLIEHVKNSLWSSGLEISKQIGGQLKLIVTKSRHNENNQSYTTREIVDILKITKSGVKDHLYQLGYVYCFDVWVPHKLSEKDLESFSACDSLLKHNENVSFLKQIVIGDEKWILYHNVEQKWLWGKQNEPPPTAPGPHPQKLMMCMWWDWESSIMSSFWQTKWLIPTSIALRPTESSIQWKVSRISHQKIIFHQGNASLHVSLMIRQKLLQMAGKFWFFTIFTTYCILCCPFILVLTKFSY